MKPVELSASTKAHFAKVEGLLDELVTYLRAEHSNVSEPKAEALFETTAEVLLGLKKAYADYGAGGEKAWA